MTPKEYALLLRRRLDAYQLMRQDIDRAIHEAIVATENPQHTPEADRVPPEVTDAITTLSELFYVEDLDVERLIDVIDDASMRDLIAREPGDAKG